MKDKKETQNKCRHICYEAQNLAIGAEDIDKVDFLRNVFLFGSILMMGKEGNYPRLSARVFSCLI